MRGIHSWRKNNKNWTRSVCLSKDIPNPQQRGRGRAKFGCYNRNVLMIHILKRWSHCNRMILQNEGCSVQLDLHNMVLVFSRRYIITWGYISIHSPVWVLLWVLQEKVFVTDSYQPLSRWCKIKDWKHKNANAVMCVETLTPAGETNIHQA